MWAYYMRNYSTGEFSVYRVEENLKDPQRLFWRNPEVFHREKGWIPKEELIFELMKGEVDDRDRVSEETALAAISTLPAARLPNP